MDHHPKHVSYDPNFYFLEFGFIELYDKLSLNISIYTICDIGVVIY